VWRTWWLGDAAADLVVAPCVILWSSNPRIRWRRRRAFEAGILLVSLGLVAAVVFGGRFPSGVQNYALEFLCLPFLIWAAFRFGQREVATAVLLLSGIAIWGTLRGFGPFVRETQHESLLLLQAFMAVTAVTALALAAVVWERRAEEKRLRRLAVSDHLTGLGNYRRLITALAAELRKSQRTGRPFAVLLLDLDDLKGINDRHGHLAGNRALCRVADALRVSCRSVDTTTRFGGDEFALILPETGQTGARRVARRISEELAVDMVSPVVSLSVGVAEYPRDGHTIESLLAVADRALYEMKALRKGRLPALRASRKRFHR
jgi:diguanylate cyclase (GGDEF)-like protein